MKKLLAACAVALSVGIPAWAQQPATQASDRHFVLENTQIIPVQSQATGRAHELVVVLPSSYAAHPETRYPVLYYLDAYWDTPLLTATYGNLVYDNQVPEFIMVGLSYPSGANYDVERRRDYTITATDADSGKADAFLGFITKEVAPLIESRFRAEKTDRVISGSSLAACSPSRPRTRRRDSSRATSRSAPRPAGTTAHSASSMPRTPATTRRCPRACSSRTAASSIPRSRSPSSRSRSSWATATTRAWRCRRGRWKDSTTRA